MRQFKLLFLVVLSIGAQAFADSSWHAPDHGFQIQVVTPEGVSFQSGRVVRISGKVMLLGKKDKGLAKAFQDGKYRLRFYYPDHLNEVTDQVSVDANLGFNYSTPSLVAGVAPYFAAEISSEKNDKIEQLEKIKSKIDLRVNKLAERIIRLQTEGKSSELIAELIRLRDRLALISSRTQKILDADIGILAYSKLPLQVDNLTADSAIYSSIMGQYRFSVAYSMGSAIEGQKANITASILSLKNPSSGPWPESGFWWENFKRDQWVAEFAWNDLNVHEIKSSRLAGGESIDFTYSTAKLKPEDANIFSVSLFKANPSGHKTGHRWGDLEAHLPVANDTTAPAWLAGHSPSIQHHYVRDAQPISMQARDSFGRMDAQSFSMNLSGQLVSGISYSRDLLSVLAVSTPDDGRTFNFSGNMNFLEEGDYTLKARAKDLAGNSATPDPLSITFAIDRTHPVITLGKSDPILTNNPAFFLPVYITDRSPANTTVIHNWLNLFTTSAKEFTAPLTLTEGVNSITVNSIDAAGNMAEAKTLMNVMLDTVPPILANLIPASNDVVTTLTFAVSGQANERLSSIEVSTSEADVRALTLAADQKTFSGEFSVPAEGSYDLIFKAKDLVGNTTVQTVPLEVVLKLLLAELITVSPNADGKSLDIIGAKRAARPGITVTASASFLNSKTFEPNGDGSFVVTLKPFTKATLTATDERINKTEKVDVYFGVNAPTLLSGRVLNTDGLPLAGVSMSLKGNSYKIVTDENGVFAFPSGAFGQGVMPTGDQLLVIDGTTVPQPTEGPKFKYPLEQIGITIGLNQNNVIPFPIHLQGIPENTPVADNRTAAISVAASNDPSVQLDIPAGAAQFPDGTKMGQIFLKRNSADAVVTPVPEFAVPDTAIHLEPSGMKFNQPVKVTLPNENNLPPGVQLVIMSMNPTKGIWEIDGIAEVSEDGSRVETLPGEGISHFSTIYAAPLGPKVSAIRGNEMPGADTFSGAVSTQIVMPSMNVLGEDVAPKLVYKSSSARPTAMVSNLFEIPKQELKFRFTDGGFFSKTERNLRMWYRPNKIVGRFDTTGILGSPVEFAGPPNKVVLSYATELKRSSDGEFLPTNIFPYTSHWSITLEHITVGTRPVFKMKDPITRVLVGFEDYLLGDPNVLEAFPADTTGSMIVENARNSSAGSGWKIAGAKQLINPEANKILIDEGDGNYSTYALNNTINTIAIAPDAEVDLTQGADLSRYPEILVTRKDGKIAEANLGSVTSSSPVTSFAPAYNEYLLSGGLWVNEEKRDSWGHWHCFRDLYGYTITTKTNQLFRIGSGQVVGTSKSHNLTNYQSNGAANFSGVFGAPPWVNSSAKHAIAQSICNNTPGMKCTYLQYSEGSSCLGGYGPFPSPGFADGTLAGARWNTPMGIISGREPNTLIVADYGNHRVRKIDLNTNTVSTIAGNGSFNSSGYPSGGDGGPAIQAKIYHPQGLVYDDYGNLYISEEHGAIRKIDTLGTITTIIGAPLATPHDELAIATKVALVDPFGMAIDSERGYLYIAESGANKIKRYYLPGSEPEKERKVETIAGRSDASADLGDGGAALNAALNRPTFVAVDSSGNLIIVDSGNNRIRKVNFSFDASSTLAYLPTSGDHSKLVRNSDGTFERSYRNGTKITFNPDGTQAETTDRTGRVTTFDYEPDTARLSRITFPTGQFFEYVYSGNLLSKIKDSTGRTTSLQHDNENNLIKVVLPDATQKRFEYSSLGMLEKEFDQRNFAKKYNYNEWNRVQSVENPDQSVVTINDGASATAANNYTGTQTPKDYGLGQGQVADGIVDAKSNETKFVKDNNGFITTVVDATGAKIEMERDLKGKPLSLTRFDKLGNEISKITNVYDVNSSNPARRDDLLSQTDSATGASVSRNYDDFGNVLTETNAKNQTTTKIYDPATGLLKKVILPKGNFVEYQHNAFAQVIRKVVQNGESSILTDYEYNSSGQVSKVTDNGGKSTSFIYDGAGNKIKSISTTNGTDQIVTQYEYDLFNRLTKVISPKNEITSYEYLSTGQLAKIIDPKNNVTIFEYNSMGQLAKKTDPLGKITLMTYDLNGNVATETNPNHIVKTFSYNQLNQVTSIEFPDDLVEYAYNTRGEVVLVKNNVSQVETDVDVKGRVTFAKLSGLGDIEDFPAIDLNYQYDELDNRTLLTTTHGSIAYGWDSGNQLESIQNSWGDTFTYTFDGAGRATSITRPGGNTNYTYASTGALEKIEHIAGGVIKDSAQLLYDERNFPILKRTPSGDYGYQYDDNGQLVSATHPALPTESFQYDELGNRTSGETGNLSYDPKLQRLQDDGIFVYQYDNVGNVIAKFNKDTSKEGFKFYYSSKNQLIKTEVLDGTFGSLKREVLYTYDVLGRRIQKRVVDFQNPTDPKKSFTRRYVYDGQNIIFEFDATNNLLARHTHNPNTLDDIFSTQVTTEGVAQKLAKSAGNYYYLKDQLGTVTSIQNSTGQILQKYDYRSFGKIVSVKDANSGDISSDPVLTPEFTYTGREWEEESGLFYYRARYYDASIGRFLQADPDPGKLEAPITVANKYVYCGNVPTVYKDPSGAIFGIDDITFLIIASIVGGLAKDYDRQGGNFFKNFLSGAFDGFVAGGLIVMGYHGVEGLVNGSIEVFSEGLSVSNLQSGFESSSFWGQLVGGITAIPAIPGAFNMYSKYENKLKISKSQDEYFTYWLYLGGGTLFGGFQIGWDIPWNL